jgi:hypothetical protein
MFRFSIREMLLASTVAGLGVALWVCRANEAESRREADELKYKVGLFEQFARWQGFTSSTEGEELVDLKVGTTPQYLDLTTSDGQHGRVQSNHPKFSKVADYSLLPSSSPSRP